MSDVAFNAMMAEGDGFSYERHFSAETSLE